MTTWTVYKHVAADESVLYVGCTSDIAKRNRAHRTGSPWWSEVAEVVELRVFTDRAAALDAELTLIRELDPPRNTTGTGRSTPKVWRDQPAELPVVPPPAECLRDASWLLVRTGATQHALTVDGSSTECGMRLEWRRAFRGRLDDETPRCQLCEKHVLARFAASPPVAWVDAQAEEAQR